MATIKISDLRPAGSDLFSDSESYLSEMSEEEVASTVGGKSSGFCDNLFGGLAVAGVSAFAVASTGVCAAGAAIGVVSGAVLSPKPAY